FNSHPNKSSSSSSSALLGLPSDFPLDVFSTPFSLVAEARSPLLTGEYAQADPTLADNDSP
ncbi:hypothetical protein A2U01_0111524, partial [Trifolium medium]|nr:hypothetical protein [Trifolium medium]